MENNTMEDTKNRSSREAVPTGRNSTKWSLSVYSDISTYNVLLLICYACFFLCLTAIAKEILIQLDSIREQQLLILMQLLQISSSSRLHARPNTFWAPTFNYWGATMFGGDVKESRGEEEFGELNYALIRSFLKVSPHSPSCYIP